MNTYHINEIFYSVQGEGMRAGTANVFVRFSGCNQTCKAETHGFDCDTEFVSGVRMTAAEIVTAAYAAIERDTGADGLHGTPWAIFTGGEPGLQLDAALCDAFRATKPGFKLAIETNGSVDVSALALDWVTVSPKVAEHCVRQLTADEVKYVRGVGQGLPKPACKATHKLISPAFNGMDVDTDALAHCIRLVKANPDWRLSVQQHKALRVR